jgi:adenylate kinase
MSEKNKFIIFLGLPGSGKGTQSKILEQNFKNFTILSTGEEIREVLKQKDHELYRKLHDIVSKGLLVDDEIIFEIVKKKILSWNKSLNSNSSENNNFILDGFPRTLNQAQMLEEFLKTEKLGPISLVCFFDLKKRFAIKRLLFRLLCQECGGIHSACGVRKLELHKMKCENKYCNGPLIKRKDDHISAIRTRLKNEKKIVDFLLKFYQNKGIKRVKLNASLKINVLHKKIKNIIDLL